MKKGLFFMLAGALCLTLAGCTPTPVVPEKTAEGLPWEESWVIVGGVIGVDTPEGVDPRENNEALAANGMYYATWSIGESESYTNEDGEEADLYDAQIYLLLGGYNSQKLAEDTLTQWKDMAALQYVIDSNGEEAHHGVDFTTITYTFDAGAGPYARGSSAFGLYRNYALSVEVTCRPDFDGDASELLSRFLENCHYAMP